MEELLACDVTKSKLQKSITSFGGRHQQWYVEDTNFGAPRFSELFLTFLSMVGSLILDIPVY